MFENMWRNRRKFEYREPSRRIFENRVLKETIKRKKAGGWRKLHNEIQHNLYSSIKVSKDDSVQGI
jgi:hypothetical protein